MKAMIYERYGTADVLKPADIPRPEPKPGEVLVRVEASSVTTADWRLRAAAYPGITWLPGRLMFGVFRPRQKVLGGDFAGTVEVVGEGANRFAPGDRVFGFSGSGSHAEFVAVAQSDAICPIPKGLSAEEAAALPFGALSALVFLRDFAKVKTGQTVLVIGATGGVGAYAVQIARQMGARVTAVSSKANHELALLLGASDAIDYRDGDYTQSGRKYDLIFDTVGALRFRQARHALNPQGIFLPLNFGLSDALQALWTRMRNGQRVLIGVSGDTGDDLAVLSRMVESGNVKPVIDRSFAFKDLPDAHRYVEGRHRRGAVVIRMDAP